MKKIKLTKLDIYTALLTLCSMLPGLFVYNRLPDKIATHFGVSGEPDRYSSKVFAVIAMPLILTAIHLFSCIVTGLDARTDNSAKTKNIVRFLTPAIAFMVESLTVLYALEKLTDITTAASCFLAVLSIVLGNYMPKTRQNSFIGIKTHKTLSDEAIWDKVHRAAGYVMTGAGIISLICIFAIDPFVGSMIPVAAVLGLTIYGFTAK